MGAKERLDYCKGLFVDDIIQIKRCEQPHLYCTYQCQGVIPKKLNILNYACYQDCVRESQVEKTVAPKAKSPPVNFISWQPKLQAKCDYKPEGEKVFVNCVVKQLTQIQKKNFAMIEYKVQDGSIRQVYVEYPNMNLLECGKGLKIRKDCNEN